MGFDRQVDGVTEVGRVDPAPVREERVAAGAGEQDGLGDCQQRECVPAGTSAAVFTGPGLCMITGLGDPIWRPLEFPAVTSDTAGYPVSVQAVRDALVKRRP
jgi:hypothetical protein